MIAPLRSLGVIATYCIALASQGQLPVLDISGQISSGGNEFEIRVRPDASFNGLFSSLVFTVRWDEAAGLSLGDALQVLPQAQYCPISKSGPETVQGDHRYQIFVGFGTIPLSSLSTTWQADEEVLLCRIPILGGPGLCMLVEDAWTATNNGDYYVSLNGEDRTGEIYGTSTSMVPYLRMVGPSLSVMPNPSSGQVRMVLDHTDAGQAYTLRLLDAIGREAWSSRGVVLNGPVEATLDLGALPAGVYTLEVVLPNSRLTERLVLTGEL